MKETKTDREFRKRMLPGVFSADGFLGTDPRSVEEIVAADRSVLARCGLSAQELASAMKKIRNAGRRGLGEEVSLPSGLRIRTETDRGLLVCPFGDSRSVAKTVTTVQNSRTGRSAAFTDMNIHLIEQHGFFEGRGAAFRIEPEALAEILERTGKDS